MNDTDDALNEESASLENSASYDSSDRNEKRNKVAFKSSYPSADLEQNLPDLYTPISDLKDFSPEVFDEKRIYPDLSFVCQQCQEFISLTEMKDHKQFHVALNYLGLKTIPKTEEELRDQRKTLIDSTSSKYLTKPKDFETNKICEWTLKINQINNAYETVMSYVDNSFEANKHTRNNALEFQIHGESNLSMNSSILAIASCSNQNKVFRKKMEDTNLILDKFGELANLTYCAVFDGYDGEVASASCATQLHLAFLFNLQKLNPKIEFLKDKYVYDEINYLEKYSKPLEVEEEISTDETEEEISEKKFHKSFIYGYNQMDKLLSRGKDETSKVRWSGTTACTCIIENKTETSQGWIHIANCGDVEAVVILKSDDSNRKSYKVLTRLHTLTTCPKDRERIEKNNGRLIETSPGVKKLQGIYSITRGLGFHGDKNVKKFISPTPSVRSYKIESNFICLIIASKGLWKSLNYKSVVDLVLQNLIFDFKYKKKALPRQLPNELAISPSVMDLLNKNKTGDDESDDTSLKSSNNLVDNSFEIRKKTGNLFGAYRNYNDTAQIKASTPTDFRADQSVDDIFYNSHRPKTTPHESMKFYSDDKKSRKKKSSDDLNRKVYSSSDIYPVKKSHAVMNRQHDLKLDLNDLRQVTVKDIKTQLRAYDPDKENLLEEKKIETSFKSIQVNDFEIRKYSREIMDNREDAKCLEVSEAIVDKLVTSALLAGSNDNITVNCILFSGSGL